MSKRVFTITLILVFLLLFMAACQDRHQELPGEIASSTPSLTKSVNIVSRDATAASRITPAPPATPSDEFLEQEQQQQDWMQTRVAKGVLTPTVTPTSTPIPTPIPAKTPGYAVYQSGRWDPGGAFFQITYMIDAWKLEYDEMFGDRLLNLQIPGCFLLLRPDPGATEGYRRIRREPNLQNPAWEVWHYPKINLITYEYEGEEHYFYVAVEYPKNVDSKAITTCQQAAEEVLSTFELELD